MKISNKQKLSVSQAVVALQDLMRVRAPKRGVELPRIPTDQILRDTRDAARSLPFDSAKRVELYDMAEQLKKSFFNN